MKNLLIINGCTRGLGLALVQKVCQDKDFEVLCLVRDTENLSDLSSVASRIEIFECDYISTESAAQSIAIFKKALKSGISRVFVINNLALIDPIGRIGEIDSELLVKSINVNIISNLLVINNIARCAIEQGKETFLLNISSTISKNPQPGMGLYGIGKCYLDYISQVIRIENTGDNIKSAVFYPGGMNTSLQENLKKQVTYNKSLVKYNYDRVINQRLLDPKEIADIIYTNFISNLNGWDSISSSIYDYKEINGK